MTDRIFSRPAIPLLAFMMSGIILGSWLPSYEILTYPVILLCTGIIIYNILHDKSSSFFTLIIFLALGYILIQPWVVPRLPSNHITHFTDSGRWRIIGEIDQNPSKNNNRLKLILRVETLERDDKSFSVTGKIRVTALGDIPEVSMGNRISFISKIRSIRNFKNPGGFDYERYMKFKKIWGSAYVQGNRLSILNQNTAKGIYRLIEEARSKISAFIDKTGFGDRKDILKALITGDKSGVSKNLRDEFNRAGVGHLLAISGLHIGIVATSSFMFFQWLLSRFSFFLWHSWVRKGSAILSLFPVVIYGLISGMSPSTQRAVIMVTVFLITFLFEREHDPINTLALAAILILAVFPPSLYSISFQLSFIAVFSIIYGMSMTYSSLTGVGNITNKTWFFKVLGILFSFILVSIFAILGTLPIVMHYFNQVSLVGVFANLLIVPMIGFVVVPLGLFSVFLYPLSISGGSVFINLSAVVLGYALEIVGFIADLPFAAVKTITPDFFEIGCYYVLGWSILRLIGLKKKRVAGIDENGSFVSEKAERRLHNKTIFRRKTAAIVAVIVIAASCADAGYWLYHRFWQHDLRVTIIDVGQGSSALVELPGGRCVLIDGGGFSDNALFDVGEKIIAPFLWSKKIKTIDTIILSHPNTDHLNGLLYIARHFNVKRVWTNGEVADINSYRMFMDIIDENNIYMSEFKEMQRMHEIEGVRINILYPPDDYMIKKEKERWRDFNNNSIVVKIEFGSKSFLFPGDIMAGGERELVAIAGDELESTVLIAPHHGSRTSSTELFLRKIKPEIVIVSAGWQNRFGFPHPSVLTKFYKLGCCIFRTDINGALTISTDGQSLKIKPFIISSADTRED
ncbi:MAG: DNA internalization-related competence protein ComEC/Rec2 [Deltaproteobacteria bacterium]|nr:DNA internalization-related competence protein ComEC/Rec2 [Deltaproteobacteria bacterium]MBW2660563.1 DNA internalization-related competence protein ComEC/Rec2 [Deltaproteobacteria bacterium]